MSELFEIPFYQRNAYTPTPSPQASPVAWNSNTDDESERVRDASTAATRAPSVTSSLPLVASFHHTQNPVSSAPPSPPPPPIPSSIGPRVLTRNPAGGFDAQTPHFRVVGNVITIIASDGDPDRIPTLLKAGHHRIQHPSSDPDFEHAWMFWTRKVGKYVAAVMFGQRDVYRQPKWKMGGWPADYTFWAKEREKPNRGKDGQPLKLRHDYYLYGSPVSSFDSTLQFVYHATWLMTGKPLKRNGKPECECTYCSQRSQKDVVAPQLQRVMHGLALLEDVRAVEEDSETDELDDIDELVSD
ncbi:hypothetical protein OF83DRAFT_1129944 [Amylostereum chailletii]|nr:hypothetical protein OF83DRAFT_1129944 [Amylostereum chailletii]